jgi:hypothetical protein
MSDVGGAQQQAVMFCVCGLFIYVYGILSLNFSAMLFLDARKSRASHARMPWEHKTKHTRVRVHTSHNQLVRCGLLRLQSGCGCGFYSIFLSMDCSCSSPNSCNSVGLQPAEHAQLFR